MNIIYFCFWANILLLYQQCSSPGSVTFLISSFITYSFTSSAMEQWSKIEESYVALCKAFHALKPNIDDCDEEQYMLMGVVS